MGRGMGVGGGWVFECFFWLDAVFVSFLKPGSVILNDPI